MHGAFLSQKCWINYALAGSRIFVYMQAVNSLPFRLLPHTMNKRTTLTNIVYVLLFPISPSSGDYKRSQDNLKVTEEHVTDSKA